MSRPRHAAALFGWLLTAPGLALAPAACGVPAPCNDPAALCLVLDEPVRVQFGFDPDALAHVDLDRDGHRDLIGASDRAGSLTVLWGSAEGLGADASTWSISQELTGVVVADLDDDGWLDLATALPRADAVAVLHGRGGRSFAAVERHAAGSAPRALLAVDLDPAGPPALVTANAGDGTISVLHRLVAEPPLAVGPDPRSLAAGDLDGDGHLDLAVALAGADAVQVLRGDGRGELLVGPRHAVGVAPYAVVVADLDADGHADLATADALDDTVSVLWGDGAGDLRGRAVWPTVAMPRALVVVAPPDELPVLGVLSETTLTIERLDPRDGRVAAGATAASPRALAAGDEGAFLYGVPGRIGVMLPAPGLVVTATWHEPDVSGAWPIDLAGDGRDVLAVQPSGSDPRSLALWGPDVGGFDIVPTGLIDPIEGVRVGDLDGDGRRDLIAWSIWDMSAALRQADDAWPSGPVPRIIATPLAVAVADVDGDGRDEVLNLYGTGLSVYASDDAGQLDVAHSLELDPWRDILAVVDRGDAEAGLILGGDDGLLVFDRLADPPRALDVGPLSLWDVDALDFDGDGRFDAVLCAKEGLFTISDVFAPTPGALVHVGEQRCRRIEAVDLDGAGGIDLLVGDEVDEHVRLEPWLATGGTWTPVAVHAQVAEDMPALARLDGGLALVSTDTGDLEVSALALGSALSETASVVLDDAPELHIGDLDGDGVVDLLGLGDRLSRTRGDGRGGFGPIEHFERDSRLVASTRHALLADLDRDGADELVLAVLHVDGCELLRVRLDGDAPNVALIATLSPQHHRVRAVDLDGDGVLDLLADRYGRIELAILVGLGDGTFAAPRRTEVEHEAWIEAVFDMDGDGLLDLVSVDGDGTQVLVGRGDGEFAAPRPWAAIVPYQLAAGDFDRDGRADLAILDRTGALLLVPGSGATGGAPRRLLPSGVTAIAAADLDGDGWSELLTASGGANGLGALHVGRADDGFRMLRHRWAARGVRRIGAHDLDGDGRRDIALIDDLGVTFVRQGP
ncbi:FG-GAP repeat domain-containing protein [Nannocystis radixulma]|uniref:VCBS repeat-containing protein n=1 Tax=Nannocystis radixulma TaxID=2995305 RepID=A0ABT5BE33_9BACT|nr:VCBS repeat-containing protein [Nannocystis radixulma]MDC0671860.1 VCBS repeat-containing protein [Nannocystis radixulma]